MAQVSLIVPFVVSSAIQVSVAVPIDFADTIQVRPDVVKSTMSLSILQTTFWLLASDGVMVATTFSVLYAPCSVMTASSMLSRITYSM